MVISLLSDEEEDESATEEHIHFTRGFREDEPIVVDSDEDIITEAHPKQEASAQGLVGSVPTPRQTNHSEHLPEHHINTQDSREQGGTDVNTGSADRLVGESASQE